MLAKAAQMPVMVVVVAVTVLLVALEDLIVLQEVL